MTIDIRNDLPEFVAYIAKRVKEHLALANPAPVSRIDFGFEFGQSNWVALAFDTRENAEPDGSWSQGIDDIVFTRPNWPIWHELPEDETVFFIDVHGNKVNVMDDPDNLICGIVGEAMKHALLQARAAGVFKPLTKASKCELGVENVEGYFGWPSYEDRGKENLA